MSAGHGVVKQCPVCGSDYFAPFNKTKVGRAKFCSAACACKGRPRPDWTGDKHPQWKGGTRLMHQRKNTNYRAKYPDKYIASKAVRSAIKSGKLVRIPCEVCGELKTEAHHSDYSKPLMVMWLCKNHHLEIHGRRKPAQASTSLGTTWAGR